MNPIQPLYKLQRLATYSFLVATVVLLTQNLFSLSEQNADKLAFYGIPKIKKFYPRETRITGKIQTLARLPNGEIAVITGTGINIFDGTNWTRFEGIGQPTGSLLNEGKTTIVSETNGLSTLSKNATGEYESQSLTPPDQLQNVIHEISHISKLRDRIFFLHGNHLTEVSSDGKVTTHSLQNWASTLFVIDDVLYVTGGTNDLLNRWDTEEHTLVDNTSVLNDSLYEWFEIVTPRAAGGVWLATQSQHIIGFDGEKSWIWKGNETLSDLGVSVLSLTETTEGGLAVGTATDGLLIFDQDGKLERQVTKTHGLESTSVNSILSDNQGGIWIASEYTLARIELDRNYLIFDDRHGLQNSVLASASFNDQIFVTTPSGLYASNADATSMQDLFYSVFDQGNLTALKVHDGVLLVGGPQIRAVKPDGSYRILSDKGATSFCIPNNRPNTILASTSMGLVRLDKVNGAWVEAPEIYSLGREFFTFAQTEDGEIFCSTGISEIARIHLTDTNTEVDIIPIKGNLEGRWSTVVEIEGHAFINTSPVLEWDSESKAFKENPEMHYYVGIPPYGFDHVFGTSSEKAYVPENGFSGHMVPRPDLSVVAQISNLGYDIETRASTLLTDGAGYYWIGGYFGIMHIHPLPKPRVEQFTPPHLSRLISLREEESLPVQAGYNEAITLKPSQNSLRIEAAFPQYLEPEKNLFQIYIEGLDRDWPTQTEIPFREVTNLRPGTYTIRVNASTPATIAYGIEIPTYDLTVILPAPWYQQKWAHALYATLGILLVGGIVKLNDRRHAKRSLELRRLVDERTQEIAAKNSELENQAKILELQNEELAEKTEELTATTETLTSTLHQLQETQEQLIDTARKAGKAEIAINVLHNVGNVLNSINVSLSMISDRVANSKVRKLERLVGLIEGHRKDIDHFLTQTPKGKAVPDFLIQLSKALNDEVSTISHELGLMEEDIAHVKSIIAAQQTHATNKSVLETTNLSALSKSALSILGKDNVESEVEFVNEIHPDLNIVTDKHQVLDIILNLLSNALDSIEEEKPAISVIAFSSELSEDGKFVELCITDNGVGIDTETQTKLFRHGFTTKEKGHGFGLHSCANAAKKLGGDLDITSPGLHKGATAILKLPLQTPKRLSEA